MYTIVGKQNLDSVNTVANRALEVLRDMDNMEDVQEKVQISSEYLLSLASGYLFLYTAVLDSGLMPSQKSAKHQIFKVH
jgi:hypothetical protein